jgi:hypothetical protein
MAILLARSYQNYPAGSVVELPASTEAALIAQGLASASVAAITPGNITTNGMRGSAAIAAAATSVVITNPQIDVTSTVHASIAQTVADATLTSIVRIVAAAGSVTIFGNAASTAAVTIDWDITNGSPVPFN